MFNNKYDIEQKLIRDSNMKIRKGIRTLSKDNHHKNEDFDIEKLIRSISEELAKLHDLVKSK